MHTLFSLKYFSSSPVTHRSSTTYLAAPPNSNYSHEASWFAKRVTAIICLFQPWHQVLIRFLKLKCDGDFVHHSHIYSEFLAMIVSQPQSKTLIISWLIFEAMYTNQIGNACISDSEVTKWEVNICINTPRVGVWLWTPSATSQFPCLSCPCHRSRTCAFTLALTHWFLFPSNP